MAAHAFNPSTEAGDVCELENSLAYISSSRIVRETLGDHVSKQTLQQKARAMFFLPKKRGLVPFIRREENQNFNLFYNNNY